MPRDFSRAGSAGRCAKMPYDGQGEWLSPMSCVTAKPQTMPRLYHKAMLRFREDDDDAARAMAR